MAIVFKGIRPKNDQVLEAKAAPRVDGNAIRDIVQTPKGHVTRAGLRELQFYAASVLHGTPDTEMERMYAGTTLSSQFAAMRANPKIARIYA